MAGAEAGIRAAALRSQAQCEYAASLASLERTCRVRLEPDVIRFTVIPDQGTQVWGQLPRDVVFDSYTLASAAGVIDLEVPLTSFTRALRSALDSSSAQLRLTKKGRTPFLAFTIVTASWTAPRNALGVVPENGLSDVVGGEDARATNPADNKLPQAIPGQGVSAQSAPRPTDAPRGPRERETVITQEVPVKVLSPAEVEDLHEPRCDEPDVHILLPSLTQLKSISERFTKLALGTEMGATRGSKGGVNGSGLASAMKHPRLDLSANMGGSLKLAMANDALRISSIWSGLLNPAIDPSQYSQNELENLPSERMRQLAADKPDDEACWARVRIDGRDWNRVLSVGRLSPKVVASFINETALILYVYLRGTEDACLTYYINSYVT
ncbi:hypothetical protein KEM52_006389 [Ascosphaera acerosa]|nr:hypothetical protein KEM52_006389 [Ascosphaera acerosa]